MPHWLRRLLDEGGGDGTGAATDDPPGGDDYRSLLGDLADEGSLANYIKTDDRDEFMVNVAKGLVAAQKTIGNRVAIPGKDATDEQRTEFWNKVGRPESADGYTIPTEEMPEGITIDEAMAKPYFDHFHRLNLTDQQGAGVIRAHATIMQEQKQAADEKWNEQVKGWEESLRGEWGTAFEQNLEFAKRFAQVGGDEVMALFNDPNNVLGSHPAMLKLMAKFGRELAEDEIHGGGGNQAFANSIKEAQDKIAEMGAQIGNPETDLGKAFMDPTHPQHKEVHARWTKLHDEAYPKPKGQ